MIRTGRQISAARALLDWSQSDLASAAGLHRNAVYYWEQRDVVPAAEPVAIGQMRAAFLAQGLRFVEQPHVGVMWAAHNLSGPNARVPAHHGDLDAGCKTRRLSPKKPSRQPVRPRRPCGAYARSTGQPCRRPALANGRCANHGGLSTGAKSPEGRERIACSASIWVRRRRRSEWMGGGR